MSYSFESDFKTGCLCLKWSIITGSHMVLFFIKTDTMGYGDYFESHSDVIRKKHYSLGNY